MEKHYDFKLNDHKIYQYWENKNLFSSKLNKQKNPYCILQPPPNRSGQLHIGHALDNTIQDILIRYHKLKGYNVLWQPGTDHGGISTSSTFEKELQKKNIRKYDIGRQLFTIQINEWAADKGKTITSQLKSLGCAFDWSREQFTMNENFSKLVLHTFVKLYHDGLIYRGKYIINWCPRCATALADDEVDEEEVNGKMYYIKYLMANDNTKSVTVATTRPETMFGDTAVAFNPSDERYIGLENQEVCIPIINRKIKLIKDRVIHLDVGTGLVKVTPAHNRTDYYIGQTHKLDTIQIINEKCKMINTNTKYDGMDRFKCREELVKELQQLGLIEKIENHKTKIGHCYRCQTIVEPYWSDQWFVKMEPLIELAQKAVNSGKIQLIPDYQTKIFNVWTSKNMDWCISRQIWHGHRIPVWYCQCGNIMCQEIAPTNCNKCNSNNLQQDPDVLDTWFSSSLWGHGVFDNQEDFEYYYPTSVLVTGKDILYFWVSRMIMMSLYMTGKIPFKHVLLHGIVRDEKGEKMSKSKANGIDPLDVIDKYGTDALRYTLMYNLSLGNDVGVSMKSFDLGKTFCTKLWNSSRYIFMNISESDKSNINDQIDEYNDFDKWILDRFDAMRIKYEKYLEEFNFSNALKELTDFFWNDFCNMYLEIAKVFINQIYTKKILLILLSNILKLYHPFTPFITESIWSQVNKYLPNYSESIMQSSFPENIGIDDNNNKPTQYFINLISKIRELKGTGQTSTIHINCTDQQNMNLVELYSDVIIKLTKIPYVDIKLDTTDSVILK
ncbi:valyl-tRNA synthetase [Fadolivirus algeromassiliense]|jgi:valyl-tRNA synthetase|uniref:valine--tRNA ligase n=1 Tax=Fadolivirus FV1/VV64 TaxID=3070911 RepID=A0A7D3UUN8_9VIRU|nr:valyl-tRNA synthetase [Fadolivirus algeromassiliense]QKF94251.1 valyl-tRNA synthetase [Fadolivirus FV1/VV64]